MGACVYVIRKLTCLRALTNTILNMMSIWMAIHVTGGVVSFIVIDTKFLLASIDVEPSLVLGDLASGQIPLTLHIPYIWYNANTLGDER